MLYIYLALAAVDLVLTIWAWRRVDRWPAMAAGLLLTAALGYMGAFSIGAIFLVLLAVQLGRLVASIAHRPGAPQGS